MSRVKDLKDAPADIIALAEQADQLQDIKVLHQSAGGKVLVNLLVKDTINAMNKLAYSTDEREKYCATLRANLDLIKLLVNAKDNEAEADRMIQDALNS